MARIRIASRDSASAASEGAWIELSQESLQQLIDRVGTGPPATNGDGEVNLRLTSCEVLTYEGLPDLGPHPDITELQAFLDAIDEFGEPFEQLCRHQRFALASDAASAFADMYQGHYADVRAWARHTRHLMGPSRCLSEHALDAYIQQQLSTERVLVLAASDGGIHVFWHR